MPHDKHPNPMGLEEAKALSRHLARIDDGHPGIHGILERKFNASECPRTANKQRALVASVLLGL
jgi:hypothetical protein